MKNISVILFISFICTLQFCFSQDARLLQVGDPAPAFTPRFIKGLPVTAFEKGKIYVLEFGATWCKPCIELIPEMSAMAEKYKGTVEVISVFVMEHNQEPLNTKDPEYVKGVVRFVQKRIDGIRYSVAVDDPFKTIEKNWLRAAGRTGVPNTFVIDKAGKISYVGGNSMKQTEAAIQAIQSKEYSIDDRVARQQAVDVLTTKYSRDKLLLIDHNGGEDLDFKFRSVLAEFKGDIKASPLFFVSAAIPTKNGVPQVQQKGMLQTIGTSLPDLYMLSYQDTVWYQVYPRSKGPWPDTVKFPNTRTVYGKYWHEPILEVGDTRPFQSSTRSKDNRFNYSLKVPPEKATAKFYQDVMRRDLKTYFGYDVRVEERVMPTWDLVLLPDAKEKLVSSMSGEYRESPFIDDKMVIYNATMRDIVYFLGTYFGFGFLDHHVMPKEDIAPYVDKTGFKGTFDFYHDETLTKNFDDYRRNLNRIGIDVVRGTRKTKVVIISDPR